MGNISQVEQKQAELIELLKDQITQLCTMTKTELGDDVIFSVYKLEKEIKYFKTNANEKKD